MSNSSIREFADQYADILMAIDDNKIELKAIEDAARDAAVNVKAMKHVAKELTMESSKLAAKLDGEDQLDMFRNAVGLRKRKGLETAQREAAE